MLQVLIILYYIIIIAGVLANGYTFYYYAFVYKKTNPYSLLCISFIFANLLVLMPSFLWILFVETKLYQPSLFVNKRLGQITILGFYAGTFSRLILSLNRFFAINFPVEYRKYFSNKYTCIFLFINWIIGLSMLIPLSFDQDCYFITIDLIWSYATTSFCPLVAYVQDFLYGVIISSMIILTDLTTASILIKRNFTNIKKTKIVSMTKLFKCKQKKVDINIFFRMVISNIFLILTIISFNFISRMVEHSINSVFVTTSMIWMFHQLIDAVIVGLLNNDIKQHILTKLKLKKENPSPDDLTTNTQKIFPKTLNVH